MGALSAFLDRAAQTPFAWGGRDCVLFFCDWIFEATGRDPAQRFRGRYSTRLGALRIIHRAGGFVALCSEELSRFGLTEATEPKAGDVGVVEAVVASGERAPVGAVFDGSRWVVLSERGLMAGAFTPLSVWRVPCPRP